MPNRNNKTPGLNPGEGAALKAAIYDLSEGAAKQLLYGVIQTFSENNKLLVERFRDILDDAMAYSQVKK